MKRPSLKDKFGEDESGGDNHISETLSEALSSNDKVIEIRPTKRSKGMGLKRLMLLGAAAVGLAYWVRNSQKPNELIESVKEETTNRTHQAAETIKEESETTSDRIEEGSERASEAVQEFGEKASERTEETAEMAANRTEEVGKKAAEQTEEAGEKAAEEADSDDSGSSSTSSSSRSSSSSGNTRT